MIMESVKRSFFHRIYLNLPSLAIIHSNIIKIAGKNYIFTNMGKTVFKQLNILKFTIFLILCGIVSSSVTILTAYLISNTVNYSGSVRFMSEQILCWISGGFITMAMTISKRRLPLIIYILSIIIYFLYFGIFHRLFQVGINPLSILWSLLFLIGSIIFSLPAYILLKYVGISFFYKKSYNNSSLNFE